MVTGLEELAACGAGRASAAVARVSDSRARVETDRVGIIMLGSVVVGFEFWKGLLRACKDLVKALYWASTKLVFLGGRVNSNKSTRDEARRRCF